MSKSKIKMKLLVDKSKHKLLFAEAGKDCVDFLFHILSLPVGTIVGFLNKEESVPSGISSLYTSLENLSTDFLQEGVNKDCLLNPKPAPGSASNVPLLTLNPAPAPDPSTKRFYTCITSTQVPFGFQTSSATTSVVHRYVSDAAGATCPLCNKQLDQQLAYVAPPADVRAKAKSNNLGGYVKGVVTYMIMDDLSVQPMSMVSSIALLNKFNVQDVANLEEREVTLDMTLGLALLKASLMSNTVLTDVFVVKKPDID